MSRWMLILILALSGCHAIAGYDPVPAPDGQRLSDGSVDQSVDLQRYVDSWVGPPPPICVPAPVPEDAIWVHRFDAPTALPDTLPSLLPAEVGTPLELVGENFSRTRGPAGCGEALSFDTNWGNYGVITDDMRLVEGTISIWVKFYSDGELAGVLSRDRSNTPEPGHLSLLRTSGGHIAYRLQSVDGLDDLLCSAHRAPSGVWHQIRITFGGGRPPTLELNGGKELRAGSLVMQGEMVWDCTTTPQITHGIEAVTFPLVVGGTLMYWSGTGGPYIKDHLHGAIDELVISGRLPRD